MKRDKLWSLCLFLIITFVLVLSSCDKKAKPFKGETYRSLDGKEKIKIYSSVELEFSKGSDPIILSKYTIEDGNKFRVVFNSLGMTQVVYFEITPEGLKDEDGTIYYSTANYEEARKKDYEIKLSIEKAKREARTANFAYQEVTRKWTQVENQLRRRYDLIPNLIEIVNDYATHEKDLFKNITDARRKYFQAKEVKGKIQASNQLENVLLRLILLREAYPDLKANQYFLKLQNSLNKTENNIAISRHQYNNAVGQYNKIIKPLNNEFKPAILFQIPKMNKKVKEVKF